jgi:hypothetical protein
MFPEDDMLPWNADTLMQLVANVRGLYAKKADEDSTQNRRSSCIIKLEKHPNVFWTISTLTT